MKTMMEILSKLSSGASHSSKEISSSVGRILWATVVCPCAKPFLQPLFAWAAKCGNHGGRPGNRVRLMAEFIKTFLGQPYSPPHARPSPSTLHGASDASAEVHGRVGIGGWICNKEDPDKHDVAWFAAEVDTSQFPHMLRDGDPQPHITSWELLGTMYLYKFILDDTPSAHLHELYIPCGTDNQGNTYSILNNKTKQWPASALVMELAWLTHRTGAQVGIVHKKRTLNKWADSLAGGDTQGFDPLKRLPCEPTPGDWDLLPWILAT